jgi:hypothetical protein
MRSLAFYLMLIMTFATAGISKVVGGSVPDWFLKQFAGSPLDLFAGSLTLAYAAIAALEVVTAVLLIVGLARRELKRDVGGAPKPYLQAGLILSQLTFLALALGQRLTHQYDAAMILFIAMIAVYVGGEHALKEK